MADTKLSALPEVTTLADTDELYINDAGSPKRITKANFFTDADTSIAAASANGINFKNKIINGCGRVNQRSVSGTVTLAADEYGHDRFKGGSGGCTYTFATSGNYTVFTITAGTLVQVVEGAAQINTTGTHVLSWTGTAQAQIDSGGYGDSGLTASLTAGTNATVEFGTGTVSKVQLEEGDTATDFEQRPLTVEEQLCMRYYEYHESSIYGSAYSAAASMVRWFFKVRKRTAAPTISKTVTGLGGTASTEYAGEDSAGQLYDNEDSVSWSQMSAEDEL